MSRYADKMSYDYCPETCPQVARVVSDFYSAEFDRFIEDIKDATSNKMRTALIEACSDLIAARNEIEELKDALNRKEDEVNDLDRELRNLTKELLR